MSVDNNKLKRTQCTSECIQPEINTNPSSYEPVIKYLTECSSNFPLNPQL